MAEKFKLVSLANLDEGEQEIVSTDMFRLVNQKETRKSLKARGMGNVIAQFATKETAERTVKDLADRTEQGNADHSFAALAIERHSQDQYGENVIAHVGMLVVNKEVKLRRGILGAIGPAVLGVFGHAEKAHYSAKMEYKGPHVKAWVGSRVCDYPAGALSLAYYAGANWAGRGSWTIEPEGARQGVSIIKAGFNREHPVDDDYTPAQAHYNDGWDDKPMTSGFFELVNYPPVMPAEVNIDVDVKQRQSLLDWFEVKATSGTTPLPETQQPAEGAWANL